MTPLSHIDPRTMPPAEAKSAWRSAVRRSRLQRGERRMGEHANSFRDQVLSLPEVEGIRCASIYASRAYEPAGDFLPSSRLADADLVVVPALGVDTLGTRLGQGAGWYDRALADARPGVPLIALVFDDEFHDADIRHLPREWHDIPVTIAVTPSSVARIRA